MRHFEKMKKIALLLIIFGTSMVILSLLGDFIGLGKRGEIGAAQILGIDIGVGIALLGIGLLTLNQRAERGARTRLQDILTQIPEFTPTILAISSFVAVYLFLFVFPMFFTKTSVQYFTKYIPDAYITHIGFDIDMTMGRVSRWLATGQSPYSDLYYYSPLTLVIFAPLLILGYPAYYKFSTIITILAYISCSLILPFLMTRIRNHTLLLILFITGMFSYGFQFELERGQYNVIAFAIALLAIYLFHNAERFRYFSYLLFSLAIQLKIYPVFLTIMFIRDWHDWKNNIRRIVGLGLFNFSLLFVLGYQLFRDFVNNLAGVQLSFQSSRREDLSIKGFVFDLTADGFGIIPADQLPSLAQHSGLIEGIFLALFAICLLSVIVYTYIHERQGWEPYLLVIATIGMLVIPSASVDYKLPLLVAPLAILFANLDIVQEGYKRIVSAVLILAAFTAYWLTLYPFTVKPFIISRNFPALFVLLISVTLLYFVRDHTAETDSG